MNLTARCALYPVYLDPVTQGHTGWPSNVLVDGLPDIENITNALKTGPYGRCVYECDNDVCDNQVRCFSRRTLLFTPSPLTEGFGRS